VNYPIWEVPAPGLLIAAVAILHVFISHFAVGGGLFLVLAETKARREADLAFLGFVRALSRGSSSSPWCWGRSPAWGSGSRSPSSSPRPRAPS